MKIFYTFTLILLASLSAFINASAQEKLITTQQPQVFSAIFSTTTSASSSPATTSTSSNDTLVASTNTASTSLIIEKENKIESCDIKVKLNQRKDKINKQIKNQLLDKNKLVDSLIEIASSTTNEEVKSEIETKIIELETSVLSIVKSQKDILNIIASTTDVSCLSQAKLKKENEKSALSIKKLNLDIEKKAIAVNKLIKTDIRQIVENLED